MTHHAFWIEDAGGRRLACLRCALRDRRPLRRALGVGAVVGSVLVVTNQGNVLVSGVWPPSLASKIPLTYAVPVAVSMWSALNSLRSRR